LECCKHGDKCKSCNPIMPNTHFNGSPDRIPPIAELHTSPVRWPPQQIEAGSSRLCRGRRGRVSNVSAARDGRFGGGGKKTPCQLRISAPCSALASSCLHFEGWV
jgi:hypothetical protein